MAEAVSTQCSSRTVTAQIPPSDGVSAYNVVWDVLLCFVTVEKVSFEAQKAKIRQESYLEGRRYRQRVSRKKEIKM